MFTFMRHGVAAATLLSVATGSIFATAPAAHAFDGPCATGDPDQCDKVEETYRDNAPPMPEPLARAYEMIVVAGERGYSPPEFAFNCTASVYINHADVWFAAKASQADGAGNCSSEVPVSFGQFYVNCSLRLDAPAETPWIGGKSEVNEPGNSDGFCPFPMRTEIINCIKFTPLIASMQVSVTEPPARVWLGQANDTQYGMC